ncbi:hypothetical protein DFH07DRAFT_959264 [Mycena maculata]|uniref:Uncharacterized protein n=1 Tax=Mycena maculata TaxID=230809 RepID=A0AAD7J2H1_9AGAR|nr:hypothetical protein DFH07DRAFT_959264 [Mycena maculata]
MSRSNHLSRLLPVLIGSCSYPRLFFQVCFSFESHGVILDKPGNLPAATCALIRHAITVGFATGHGTTTWYTTVKLFPGLALDRLTVLGTRREVFYETLGMLVRYGGAWRELYYIRTSLVSSHQHAGREPLSARAAARASSAHSICATVPHRSVPIYRATTPGVVLHPATDSACRLQSA